MKRPQVAIVLHILALGLSEQALHATFFIKASWIRRCSKVLQLSRINLIVQIRKRCQATTPDDNDA